MKLINEQFYTDSGKINILEPFSLFWIPGLPEGVLSNCPCLLVRPSVGPSVNILKTVHCFFLIFSMKLEHHKGTKVTEPDF